MREQLWNTNNRAAAIRVNGRAVVIPPGLEVTLHLSDDAVLEGATPITVTATASPASPVAFTVEISASPVAPATADEFELSTNRTLRFAAGATGSTGTVTIRSVDDDEPEPREVVTISGVVSNPAIPNPDDVTLTIHNNDVEFLEVAIDAPAAVDEDAGTATVTYTLTKRDGAPVANTDVNFYHGNAETATRGLDYTPPVAAAGLAGGRLVVLELALPPSAFSNTAGTVWVWEGSFEIGIVDDGEAERDETIVFTVEAGKGESPEQTIVIRDDDTPVMRNVRVVNGPSAAGMWSAGEQVELEVRYTLPVAVEQPSSDDECWSYNADGTCKPPGPYVAVVFRSDARPGYGEVLGVALARYVSGSGTATLRFAYTVGAAEAGARGVEVVDGKVLLRGATIRPLGGGDDVGPEFTRTRVMQVDVQEPGGGAWTAGDKVRVTVKFRGPGQRNLNTVKVNKTGGTPTIGLRLGDPENRLLARTASYKGGSGSNTLSFEYAVTAGDGRISAVEVVPNSLARNGATIRNKQGYDAELDHLGVLWYSAALRVRDAAAREGETLRFTMELAQAAKAPVTVDYETADGTATAGEDYEAKRGTVRFAPGHTRKTVAVPVLRDEETEDAETVVLRLSNARSEGSEDPVEVTDPEAEGTIEDVASEGLTASFEGVPEEHDGESAFTFRAAFSEPIAISFRSLREDAFETTGGRVTRGTRVDGRKDLFEITVEPDGDGDVTIELPAGRECATSGAICTWGPPRKQLTNTPSATVAGPADESPAVSVSDASATEGDAVEFTVSLSAASGRQVTVRYGTSDGTAESGTDYTEASGTLTFAAGETEKTVSVATTDDSADEEDETFTLTLSNAADATLGDATATGTIVDNDDALTPLTAEFRDMPETHDGESAFTFRVAFSEPLSWMNGRRLREGVVAGAGGRATSAGRVDRRRDLWELTVEPDSLVDVTVTLAAGAACGTPAAVCTKDGRALSETISATVRGPAGSSAASAPMKEDLAARACSALAGGDGPAPGRAAAALWRDGDMDSDQLAALDGMGNGNGTYDLGDLLAWINRCRPGSGSAAGAGPPPSAPPAMPASQPARGASQRRKGARGPARRRRTAPETPAAGSRTRRFGWLRTVLLAALIAASGCGDGIVDPRADAPRHDGAKAAVVDPGSLHVRLTAPPQARDIGAMLVIEGPAIDSVQAPGLEMFETDESSSTRREVIIAGALPPDGPLLRLWVPHRGDQARYRIRLLQVAGEDFTLRDLTAYGTAISR